jgi:hypothetical protein
MELVVIPISVAMLAFGYWSWKTMPKNVPLDWVTFSTFMRRPEEYAVVPVKDFEDLPADFGMNVCSIRESVMYYVSERQGHLIETVDFCRYGMSGFIVTFVDASVAEFQRIGGRPTDGSHLSLEQLTILEGIRVRLAAEAKKQRN